MARVRILLLTPLVLALAACGGRGGHTSTSPLAAAGPRTIAGAGASTIGAGTARFTLSVRGVVGGIDVSANEQGSLAFTRERAHIYKLVLSGGVPEELIVDGPIQYANGNVEAAMNDPSVKPWTRLDRRRLTAGQRLSSDNELAHVRAPAFLIDGVEKAVSLGAGPGGTTHFRGTVDPRRLAARVPAGLRSSLAVAVRNDYLDRPFPADFWIDSKHRVRHVRVSYRTKGGGRITVDATYSDFGAPVRLGVPPARETRDITP
jgi:hypothetical protein